MDAGNRARLCLTRPPRRFTRTPRRDRPLPSRRSDAARNMHRYYRLDVQEALGRTFPIRVKYVNCVEKARPDARSPSDRVYP